MKLKTVSRGSCGLKELLKLPQKQWWLTINGWVQMGTMKEGYSLV